MTRDDFLTLIFSFFKVKDDDNQLKKIYDTALSTRKRINWETLYTNIIKTVETRYLPAPKWFIEKMKYYEIIEESSLEGKKVLITYDNGKRTEYVIKAEVFTTLQNVLARNKNIAKAELFNSSVTFFENLMYPTEAQGQLLYKKGEK